MIQEQPVLLKILYQLKRPNNAVPNAVEKTIKAVVKAFIEPMYLTP